MEYTDGSVKFRVRRFGDGGGGGVLRGVIMAFSGTFDENGCPIDKNTGNADATWHLCDGTNGTPDLRGRFILGASVSHAPGTTGGEEAHSLTRDENAPHDHGATCSRAGLHAHNIKSPAGKADDGSGIGRGYIWDKVKTYNTEQAGEHDHQITIGVSGSGAPHNNMPPYYTLSYIMKL